LLQALARVNRNTEIEYRQSPTLVSGLRQVVITGKTAIDNKQDAQVYTVAGRVTRKRAMLMFIKRIRGICDGTEAVFPDT